MPDWKNEIIAVGGIMASTAFFGWLLYLIIGSSWWVWLCWVLGIVVVLCWIVSIIVIALYYLIYNYFQPAMNSIKEAIGISSWWDLPEAIWRRWCEITFGI